MRKPSVTRTIVSVPYWGSLYFNRYSKDTYDVLSWFPSPIGVLYISIRTNSKNTWNVSKGFRPLLGFFIFQCLSTEYLKNFIMFPSPIGVLYISIASSLFTMRCMALFPSPIGVLYISMSMIEFCCDDLVLFPSPIGVLYISIRYWRHERLSYMGFRPLLGFFIFQSKITSIPCRPLNLFPSPIGVLYISILKEGAFTEKCIIVSVPYWGSLYFNGSYADTDKDGNPVSVPYWGSLYFNK